MDRDELKAKHATLHAAYKETERLLDDDENYTDELADKYAAQFAELVALEEQMAAAGVAA